MDTLIPARVIERAIVVKPIDDNRLLLITATHRTAAAYRMALDLAEGLVARQVKDGAMIAN